MADVLVGTCGYHYTEWIGPVYPEGAKKEEFLPRYAGMFGTVELDYTYYTMPKAARLADMAAQGGPDLTFAVKAHQSLTHRIDPAGWEGDAGAYLEALEPLREAPPGHPKGRLEAVLFQFPYSFHYEADNRRHLDRLLRFFREVPKAVEFRNAEWINDRVIGGLRERGAALASVDMPDLKGLPPALEEMTAPFAYIRLHGRNRENWWGSDAAARYDYLYTDRELEAWGGRIKRMAVKADRVLVYFNNHARGQAVENARMLENLLKKQGP
jgi:uncharacterized protein YecE (DUF72 family)